ncbi:hydrogenase maturation protease [Amycolatopsis nigrescens]|uniref:hydrogenase maturation protease n=1 Tax=Amycolatopsis nigrescens TaxID=381445 RepID=UPI00035D2BBD|nr:hydrogenase maturation protease [Amycolatopsis nigrescens]
MKPRVLIAGLGNAFLGDDAFGVEVARRLAEAAVPAWVQIADYGIGGMRLACDLLGGYDTTILIDVVPRGGKPGTVSLIEAGRSGGSVDAHGMRPDAVFRMLELLGGDAGEVLVVGCEPGHIGQGAELSPPVAAAVDEAVRLVADLAWGCAPENPLALTAEA